MKTNATAAQKSTLKQVPAKIWHFLEAFRHRQTGSRDALPELSVPAKDAAVLDLIGRKVFGVDTLETQNTSGDFHDVSVWQMKKALELAYLAGVEAGTKK